MSKEKQIEEMDCEKCLHYFACLVNSEYVPTPCVAYEDKAGYRKQSDNATDTNDGRKSEWISVDERLPQITGKYICSVKEKYGNAWTIAADWDLEMKTWFGEFGEIKNIVTHWMPLPEAPKTKGGAE